jgi:hypothetical protein
MKRKATKVRQKAWFVRRHWSYLPVSPMGWLTYIPFLAFLFLSLWAVQQNTNNVLGSMFDAFPYWISAGVIMHWIAGNKS